MYGQHRGQAEEAVYATDPPRDRIDAPLYNFARNYPFRFVPQYLKPYGKESEQNVSNLMPFQYYRQPMSGHRTTPSIMARLQSHYAFIPQGIKLANLGSS